jgi:hypothetical protein
MGKLSIAGTVYEVSAPYQPGHTIDEREAKVLNQTRAENIGNNLRAEFKQRIEKGEDPASFQADVSKYDSEYTFAMGGSAREPVDPLEKEIQRVIKEALKEQGGRKLKEYSKEELEQIYADNMDNADVVTEAKKRLKAKQKKASFALRGVVNAAEAQPSA